MGGRICSYLETLGEKEWDVLMYMVCVQEMRSSPVDNVFELVESALSDQNSYLKKMKRYIDLYRMISKKKFFLKDRLTTISQKYFYFL